VSALSEQRILGRVDTPPEVALALARRTLAALEGEPLRVLDPACGAAALLVAAARAARETGRAIALHGVEKDAGTLVEARLALRRARLDATLGAGDALLDASPGGFDAVIANPPWVSFSGREAVALDPGRKAELRARYESFRGWPSLQGPFLERSLALVRPGGRVGIVLPRQVLELDRYAALRRVATARARVLDVADLGEDVFAGVCEPAATIVLERRERDVPGDPAPWRAAAPALARWASRALARLERHPRLPRALVSDPGVHTGNAAKHVLAATPRPGWVPCREGKDVKRFELAPPRLTVDPAPALEEPLYATVRAPGRYRGAAIVVRQTADRPIAARHRPWAHFRNSALAVSPGALPVEVVLALLNSRLFALDHRARTADARQRSFPQVKVSALARLAYPANARTAACEALVALVRRREAGDAAGLEASIERAVCGLFGVDGDAASALLAWLP
jgi:hypothetical protein